MGRRDARVPCGHRRLRAQRAQRIRVRRRTPHPPGPARPLARQLARHPHAAVLAGRRAGALHLAAAHHPLLRRRLGRVRWRARVVPPEQRPLARGGLHTRVVSPPRAVRGPGCAGWRPALRRASRARRGGRQRGRPRRRDLGGLRARCMPALDPAAGSGGAAGRTHRACRSGTLRARAVRQGERGDAACAAPAAGRRPRPLEA